MDDVVFHINDGGGNVASNTDDDMEVEYNNVHSKNNKQVVDRNLNNYDCC